MAIPGRSGTGASAWRGGKGDGDVGQSTPPVGGQPGVVERLGRVEQLAADLGMARLEARGAHLRWVLERLGAVGSTADSEVEWPLTPLR